MSGTPDQPSPGSTPWRGRDLRPVAIGAVAGLLVLVVGGIAFAASQSGAPTTAEPVPQGDHGPAGGHPPDGRGPVPHHLRERLRDHRDWPGARLPFGDGIGSRITISAISGSDITFQTANGWTRTISVTDATRIERAGQKITVSDLKVGDAVRIHEVPAADGSTTIAEIDVVLPRVLGRVTATAADSITIQRADGTTMTVRVGPSTTYHVRDVPNAGLADIKVGMVVLAEGSQDADGSLEALSIKAAALP